MQLPKVEDLKGQSRPELPGPYHGLVAALLTRFQLHADRGQYGARQLSNGLWACAKLYVWQGPVGQKGAAAVEAAAGALLHLASKVLQLSGELDEQQGTQEPQLLGQEEERVHQQRRGGTRPAPDAAANIHSPATLHPLDVCSTLWALVHILPTRGLAGASGASQAQGWPLPADIAEASAAVMGEVPALEPVSVVWQLRDPETKPDQGPRLRDALLWQLVGAMVAAVPGVAPALRPQEVSTVMWALAHLSKRLPGASMLEQERSALRSGLHDAAQAVGEAAKGVMKQLTAQHVSCIAWALATLGMRYVWSSRQECPWAQGCPAFPVRTHCSPLPNIHPWSLMLLPTHLCPLW